MFDRNFICECDVIYTSLKKGQFKKLIILIREGKCPPFRHKIDTKNVSLYFYRRMTTELLFLSTPTALRELLGSEIPKRYYSKFAIAYSSDPT